MMKSISLIRSIKVSRGILLGLIMHAVAVSAAPVSEGDFAPTFNVKTLEGPSVTTENLPLEKPVYLKFWATWCTFCVEEMPHTQQIYNTYGDKVEVIAVDVGMNDSLSKINAFLKANDYSLPVNFDADGQLTSQFGVLGTPQHILIGRNGKVLHRSALITDDLEDKIQSAIAQINIRD